MLFSATEREINLGEISIFGVRKCIIDVRRNQNNEGKSSEMEAKMDAWCYWKW